MSPSTVATLNKKIYAKIEEWRHKPIDGAHPYHASRAPLRDVLDGIMMKRTWAGDGHPVPFAGANGTGTRRCATSRSWWRSA